MADLETIQREAQEALGDLSQGGMLGLVALTTAAEAYRRVQNLSLESLSEDRAALAAAQEELEQLERLVESHKGALNQAFSRLVSVIGSTSAGLAEVAEG